MLLCSWFWCALCGESPKCVVWSAQAGGGVETHKLLGEGGGGV